MASYINKKDRVFYPAGDCPPLQFHRQRPEACLKTYYSCTDTRVWELAEEPRRQHLREILSTPVGLQLGNYVPVEMLINILMCSDAEVCIKEKDYGSSVGYHRSYGTNNEASNCFCCNSSASRQIKTCGTQCPPMKSYTSKETVCCDRDKEINKLNNQIEKLEYDIKCAKKNIYDNEKLLCQMSNEIKDKTREISEKTNEIISIKKDLCEKTNEIASLKNESCQKSEEIQSLKTELCQKSNFAAESLKKLELLNRKLHDSECERKELERKNCEHQKTLQKLEDDCIKPQKMCDLQQELNKLREYCQFLSKAQEQAEKHSECLNTENQGLKKELRGCHQTLADQSGKLAELHSNADNLKQMLMEKDGEICRLKKDVAYLQEDIRYQTCQLKEQLAKAPEKCQCSHNSAEEKARKYKQKFKELEAQLRELSCACGKNKKDLQQMECLQKERDMLQRRVDELSSIEQAYNSCRNQLCDMQNIMAERDMLRMKLLNMSSVEEEVERLRSKTKEMECLRAERNRLKQRNEELEAIEAQYIELLSVQKELEGVKCDRDRLKCKIEELMRQNYDKQRQICEMETELKQLIAQIDHMTEEECKQDDCNNRKKYHYPPSGSRGY
ncbi:interaptin-like [Chrysoperla carnea]|uniref:interaptin-like n=1 Tax=Chrysoperla carnea TaxID=189513 RepID=UPI001D06CEFF|nr:interaptin-like [Chrysoperla carnea]